MSRCTSPRRRRRARRRGSRATSDANGAEPREPRLILYVGKGGVGKTTVAAATAVRAAALGLRTLVVSTDIAHSLGDVLDVAIGAEPTPIAERLDAQEINVLEETRQNWGRLQEKLSEFLQREGLSEIQADELAIVPGMEEVAALAQIARRRRSGVYECIVVDAAPTGETIRLLSMPESVAWYTGRLDAWKSGIIRLAGPFLRGIVPQLNLLEGSVARIAGRIKELRAALTDPRYSSYRIVVTPDRTVLKEARRAETYLNLFEYPVDAVVINRVVPRTEPGSAFLDALLARQERVLAEIRNTFPTLPQFRASLTATEPVGLALLDAFARELFGGRDPTAVLHVGPTLRIESADGGYVLRIPMPNVETTKLALRKQGDELYIDVGNFRREITLPGTLVALEPGTARLRNGGLEIPFQPVRS